MDAFYQTMSGFCFTLMGLWWAVVQFRHDEWMDDPNQRRLAYSIHLSFLLPGLMSLVAMAAGDVKLIWQAAFALAGLLGAVAMTLFMLRTNLQNVHGWVIRRARWLVIALYILVALFAVNPSVAQAAVGLKPLQLEGLVLSLLVLLGVSCAWDLLAEPKSKTLA
jgi:hypothetical protein